MGAHDRMASAKEARLRVMTLNVCLQPPFCRNRDLPTLVSVTFSLLRRKIDLMRLRTASPAGLLCQLCSQVVRSSALAALSVCLLVARTIGGIAGLLMSVSVFVPVFIPVVLIFGVSASA